MVACIRLKIRWWHEKRRSFKRANIMMFPKGQKQKIKITPADRWFSYFIRLRDAYDNGYVSCCTCGKPFHVYSVDCGHFQTRDRQMTRFNERNAHPQCKWCNGTKKGEQSKHHIYINNRYGPGTAEKLVALAGVRGAKISKLQLKEIANEYRIKTYELIKSKGIEPWWKG